MVTCPWTSSLTRSLHGGHNGSCCPAAACLSATGLRAGNSGAQRPPRPCSSEPRHCPGQAPGPGFQLGIGTQGPCRRCLQRDDPGVSHAWNAGLPPSHRWSVGQEKNKTSVHRSHRGQGLSSPGSSWLLGVLPALDVAALSSERRWKVGARITADLTPSAPRGPTWLLLTRPGQEPGSHTCCVTLWPTAARPTPGEQLGAAPLTPPLLLGELPQV